MGLMPDNPINDMLLPPDVMYDITKRVYPHEAEGAHVVVKTPKVVASKVDVGPDVPGGGAA